MAPKPIATLPRAFYARDTREVAQDLLGRLLVHSSGGVERSGLIVETEAYLGPHDQAAHSRHGKTARNAPMFGPVGHAYVYLVYGLHECMNVVTEGEGRGSAVLIRALEPVANCEGRTNGPGLLTRALHISRHLSGHDLVSDDLFIARVRAPRPASIVVTRRVGVEYAGRWAARRLRFYVRGNRFVSKPWLRIRRG